MLKRLSDISNPHSLASRLRARRLERFQRIARAFDAPVRVLDVGGTVHFWDQAAATLQIPCEVTLLNTEAHPIPPGHPICVASFAGDGRDMRSLGDRSFDVVFSNSVIEHVGTFRDQLAMAKEIRRVGRSYYVQTPNRYFPIEPHFLCPCWQFFPISLRAFLHRHVHMGWMPRQPDPAAALAEVKAIRLLSRRELRSLFPDGDIAPECFGGMVKSWMAIGPQGRRETLRS